MVRLAFESLCNDEQLTSTTRVGGPSHVVASFESRITPPPFANLWIKAVLQCSTERGERLTYCSATAWSSRGGSRRRLLPRAASLERIRPINRSPENHVLFAVGELTRVHDVRASFPGIEQVIKCLVEQPRNHGHVL